MELKTRLCVWTRTDMDDDEFRLCSHLGTAIAKATSLTKCFFELHFNVAFNLTNWWQTSKKEFALAQYVALCEWAFIPLDDGGLLHLDPAEQGGSLNQHHNVRTLSVKSLFTRNEI